MQNIMPVDKAIISVSDKRCVEDLAKGLFEYNPNMEILSSSGTAKLLRDSGYQVTDISTYTGFPESPGGFVKTLHPKVHAGIMLDRDVEEHRRYMESIGANSIGLIVINFYPLAKMIADGKTIEEIRVHGLDVGGPTMVSAAVKAYPSVAVVTNPDDYTVLLHELATIGGTSLGTRLELAKTAARAVADYDREKADFLKNLTTSEVSKIYL